VRDRVDIVVPPVFSKTESRAIAKDSRYTEPRGRSRRQGQLSPQPTNRRPDRVIGRRWREMSALPRAHHV
jgi:hypothetical protein